MHACKEGINYMRNTNNINTTHHMIINCAYVVEITSHDTRSESLRYDDHIRTTKISQETYNDHACISCVFIRSHDNNKYTIARASHVYRPGCTGMCD